MYGQNATYLDDRRVARGVLAGAAGAHVARRERRGGVFSGV